MLVTKNPNHAKNEVSFEDRKRLERLRQLELQDQKDKKSPYCKFLQMNLDERHWTLLMQTMDTPKSRVLFFLMQKMDKYNAVVCSHKVIEEALGLSHATVSRAVRDLKEGRMIHVMKSGTTNVYVINPDVAWKSWRSNRRYCQFPANVILSASEQ